ncbi:hypothetical protein SVIOM74S_07991 [Streptomyces violarus]
MGSEEGAGFEPATGTGRRPVERAGARRFGADGLRGAAADPPPDRAGPGRSGRPRLPRGSFTGRSGPSRWPWRVPEPLRPPSTRRADEWPPGTGCVPASRPGLVRVDWAGPPGSGAAHHEEEALAECAEVLRRLGWTVLLYRGPQGGGIWRLTAPAPSVSTEVTASSCSARASASSSSCTTGVGERVDGAGPVQGDVQAVPSGLQQDGPVVVHVCAPLTGRRWGPEWGRPSRRLARSRHSATPRAVPVSGAAGRARRRCRAPGRGSGFRRAGPGGRVRWCSAVALRCVRLDN